MTAHYLDLAVTPSVRRAQAANGTGAVRERPAPAVSDRFTAREAAFIAARDSFYLASAAETGWPYVQHRGGPQGFLRVLDERTLGFAEFRGNRQYLSLGNVAADDRVALLLMDYPNRRRLKILARMRALEPGEDAAMAARLAVPGYKAKIERGFVLRLEAFDWNCPQHITPRFTGAEIAAAVAPLHERIASLAAENAALRARLEQGEIS
jgi:predicted pyridoxine 5'-phosphate oxidase superfamily flavin-nucleotide-binding protein